MIVKIKGWGTGGVQRKGMEENRGKGWEEVEQSRGFGIPEKRSGGRGNPSWLLLWG